MDAQARASIVAVVTNTLLRAGDRIQKLEEIIKAAYEEDSGLMVWTEYAEDISQIMPDYDKWRDEENY